MTGGERTARQARKLVEDWLREHALAEIQVRTATTVRFSDLARGSAVFVEITKPLLPPLGGELDAFAHNNGFYVDW